MIWWDSEDKNPNPGTRTNDILSSLVSDVLCVSSLVWSIVHLSSPDWLSSACLLWLPQTRRSSQTSDFTQGTEAGLIRPSLGRSLPATIAQTSSTWPLQSRVSTRMYAFYTAISPIYQTRSANELSKYCGEKYFLTLRIVNWEWQHHSLENIIFFLDDWVNCLRCLLACLIDSLHCTLHLATWGESRKNWILFRQAFLDKIS